MTAPRSAENPRFRWTAHFGVWSVPEGILLVAPGTVHLVQSDWATALDQTTGHDTVSPTVRHILRSLEGRRLIERVSVPADSGKSQHVQTALWTARVDSAARKRWPNVRTIWVDDYSGTCVPHATQTLLLRSAPDSIWIGPLITPNTTDPSALKAARYRLAHAIPDPSAFGSPARLVRSPLAPHLEPVWNAAVDYILSHGSPALGIARVGAHDVRTVSFGLPSKKPPPNARPYAFRACSTATTWSRVRTLVDEEIGPIFDLSETQTAGRGATRFDAVVSIDRFPTSPAALVKSRVHTTGVNANPLAARVGAVCEALERYCGAYRDGDAVATGPTCDERNRLSPEALLAFSADQYASASGAPFDGHDPGRYVPLPLPIDSPIWWSPARSLIDDVQCLVPTAWAYYFTPDPVASRYLPADSNGCAAGNTFEEAVLYGLLELIERDAAAIWWYNRLRRPGVPLDTYDHPIRDAVRSATDVLGRTVWALDLTTDLGVPVYAVLSGRRDASERDSERILVGFGAHLSSSLALARALASLLQKLPPDRASDSRLRLPRSAVQTAEDEWFSLARSAELDYLHPGGSSVSFPPAHSRDIIVDATDLRSAVATALSAVRRGADDVFVLDQSRPEVPMSVVRVIAPGLRPLYRRLGPGRLYTVNTEAHSSEATLNPFTLSG